MYKNIPHTMTQTIPTKTNCGDGVATFDVLGSWTYLGLNGITILLMEEILHHLR